MPNRSKAIILLAAGIILLAAAGLWGICSWGRQPYMPGGVTFGGVSVEGMSYDAAEKLLQDRVSASAGWIIRYDSDKPGGSRQGAFQSIGLRWDTSAPVRALSQLREGNAWERAWHKLRLRGQELPLGLLYDETAYEAFVQQSWAEMHGKQPVAAKRTITEKDQVEIIPDIPAYRVDAQELLKRLLAVDWQQIWKQEPGAQALQEPVAAIALPVTEIRSQFTYEALAEQGIKRKISEFSTTILPGGEGRFHNISSAALIIQDRLLAPGEIFDYAPVVKETEARYGFREAPVIYNGKLVPGVGGGICQVSTTLYNAVLRAGLEIVERRNHSLPVSYAPLGQDATFSEDYINFRFRNTTGAHLLIRTETQKDKLTVKLFGTLPEGVLYEIESVIVQQLEAPVKTVVNPSLKIGQRETLQKGKPGYVVETYRTKKENGTIMSKELLSKDHYQPQPFLIAVGGQAAENSGNQPNSGSGVLEDGVDGPRFR